MRHMFRRCAALGSVRLSSESSKPTASPAKAEPVPRGEAWAASPLARGALYLMCRTGSIAVRSSSGTDLPRRARGNHRPGAVGGRASRMADNAVKRSRGFG